MAVEGAPQSIIKQIKAIVARGLMQSFKCKSKILPIKKSLFLHIPKSVGFLWGLRNGKTTEAEFRIIEKHTLFLNQERL